MLDSSPPHIANLACSNCPFPANLASNDLTQCHYCTVHLLFCMHLFLFFWVSCLVKSDSFHLQPLHNSALKQPRLIFPSCSSLDRRCSAS